jgi:hypothetical protein
MEVHAHTHTARKKWTHYLWEFLMLFLAVFCGFLAENQREHMVEHQREKQYMASLVRDVELDIESLKQSSASRKELINYYDSLVLLLEQRNKKSMNDIYFYARFLFRMAPFSYHDRTIVQLKSSGGLRLVRNKKAADSITIYDNETIKHMLYQQELETQLRNEIFANHVGKIFNAYVWNKMVNEKNVIMRPEDNPDLITDNQTVINDFVVQVVTLKTAYRSTNRFIESTIRSAENLNAYVKKEYHLN